MHEDYLNTTQMLQFLEFCLNTTHFVYDEQFYKLIHGAAMGSFVSFLSDSCTMYMADLANRAL